MTPLWARRAQGSGPVPAPASARRAGPGWSFHLVSGLVLVVMLGVVLVRGGGWTPTGVPQVVFTLAAWAPLLLRGRQPAAALLGSLVAEAVHVATLSPTGPELVLPAAMGVYQPVPLATMVAVYAYAVARPPAIGWRAGLAGAAVLVATARATQPLALLGTDLAAANCILIATALGVARSRRRRRAARLERERHAEVRREVQAERLRIARELHDGLAHHLTLVNAQAAVAEHLLTTRPDAAATALRGITEHTRHALDEVRATVGLLRDDDTADDVTARTDPEHGRLPRLSDTALLVEQSRAGGQTVRLTSLGDPRALTAQADLAAYRLVQEALTNAAKHAPGSPMDIEIRWGEGRVDLTASNGRAQQPPLAHPRSGGGHGLLGMRERVTASGGDVTTQPTTDGGFTVRAWLPTSPTRPPAQPAAKPPVKDDPA